jgi:hypothetical protein
MAKFIWRGIEDEQVEMTMFGRTWQANIAQDASDVKNIKQDVCEKVTLPTGELRQVGTTILVSEADMLRGNPTFDEVGQDPKEHKKWKRPAYVRNAAEEHGDLGEL